MGIRDLRIKANLTQTELARKTNLSRQCIGDLERGRYDTHSSIIVRISRALDTCPCKVLDFECNDCK
jgi:DNA-binding XRE family transcriptional regulator